MIGDLKCEKIALNNEILMNNLNNKTLEVEMNRFSEIKLKKLKEQETAVSHYMELNTMVKHLHNEIQTLENQTSAKKKEIIDLNLRLMVISNLVFFLIFIIKKSAEMS